MLLPLLTSACGDLPVERVLPPRGADNPRPLETGLQTDIIVRPGDLSVDVLWVVDNSASMVEERTVLEDGAPAYLDVVAASGVDYHVGVVTTDMESNTHSGKLRQAGGVRWIQSDTPDAHDVFTAMLDVGLDGAAIERGRDAAYAALEIEGDHYNAGFERTDAELHVIVVSDESDYSSLTNLAEFISYLQTRKSGPHMVSFSSIVMYPPPEAGCVGLATPGDAYLAVTRQVGGTEWNVCDRDWLEVVERLDLDATPPREFFLSRIPIVATLQVQTFDANGVTQDLERPVDWVYRPTRNSILLQPRVSIPVGEVRLTYEVRDR